VELSLATHSFSRAKAGLSDLMSEVVREHQPAVIERNRGKEAMALLPLDDLRRVLDSFTFSTTASVSEGEFVLRQPELGLIAGGDSFDEAVAELRELALAYARQFFARSAFYLETDRAAHLPYLLRVAITPPAELAGVLVPTPSPSAAPAEVTREQFWETIRAGEPVDRPVPVEQAPAEHPAWIVKVLSRDLHLSPNQIEKLTPQQAQRKVEEHWSGGS
jgi:uncharacterized protein (DUF2267 family)